MDITGIRETGI